MSKRGENIYIRKDGRYEGRYVKGKNLNGCTKFGYIYGTRYSDVKRRLIEKKRALSISQHPVSTCDIKFIDLVQQWQCMKRCARIKPSTERTYNFLLNKYMIPVLGNMSIGSIDSSTIVNLFTQMSNKEYALTTISATLRLLSAIFNSAVENDLIDKNPCRAISIGKFQPSNQQRVLSMEEQQSIEKSGELSIYLGLYTGMRIGEICGLRWSDIDWGNNTITVRRTVQREKNASEKSHLTTSSPKTPSSYRVIPLAEILCLELRKHYSDGNKFILGKGDKPCDPRTLERKFKKITESAGISNVHFHSLRHTFATRMISMGVDIKTTSSLLGHNSVKTTLDIYAHSNIELKKEAIKKL